MVAVAGEDSEARAKIIEEVEPGSLVIPVSPAAFHFSLEFFFMLFLIISYANSLSYPKESWIEPHAFCSFNNPWRFLVYREKRRHAVVHLCIISLCFSLWKHMLNTSMFKMEFWKTPLTYLLNMKLKRSSTPHPEISFQHIKKKKDGRYWFLGICLTHWAAVGGNKRSPCLYKLRGWRQKPKSHWTGSLNEQWWLEVREMLFQILGGDLMATT